MKPAAPRQTILIVDDQPANIDILHDILRAEFKIKVALNGEQALHLAQAGTPPDLVLLDIMMPGMDGYEVCRQLKNNPFSRGIPVIFVTAMTDVVDESKGFELGAVDYITKPVVPPLVLARVRAQLALYDQNRSLEEMVRRRTEELQHANQRLEQERARFEWMVSTADEGYLILDRDGHIQFANDKARVYLSIESVDMRISETFIGLARRQYQVEPEEAWAAPLTQALSQPRYLIRPETAASQAFWLLVDIVEISADGVDEYWVVRLRDVTEHIGTQRNWGSFSEMVNHKLRTPLSLTISSLEVLNRHGADLSAKDVLETARYAERGMLRLQQTVEDVLAYLDVRGLSDSGQGFCLTHLPQVAAEIASGLKIDQLAVASCAELKDATIRLSQRGLDLILWELMENSLKFHPQNNPTIDLMILPSAPGTARLQLRDDGKSLSPEQLQHLWTPFYQAEKYFSGEVPGMGLGLSQVASLVWNVGGKCFAFNREDQPGLIIELLLPLQEETPAVRAWDAQE